MLWTLIVTATVLGYDYRSSGNVAMLHVPGFASYQDCVNAGEQVPSPASDRYNKGTAKFVCVKMGDKA